MFISYRISSNKRRTSNKRSLLINVASLGYHWNKRLPSNKRRTSKA